MINTEKNQSWELVWFEDNLNAVESIDTCIEDHPMITYRETEFKRQLNNSIKDLLIHNCIVHANSSVYKRLAIQYRHAWWQRFPKGVPEL